MKKVVIQFNNLKVKTFKIKGDVTDIKCSHLNWCMLLKYKNLSCVQTLMDKDAYYTGRYKDFSVLNYFCSSILNCEQIDGRTKSAKKLPWFCAEEFLLNFE